MELVASAATHLILLRMLFISTHAKSDLNSDATALLEFAATVPSVRELNWESDTPICKSWVGISCSKNETRVVEINLPGIGLYGSIPTNTIGKLDALEILSLRSNFLNGNLPPDILSFPSLHSLFLQNNNFSGSIPLPATLSPRLTVVYLAFNSLSGRIPDLNLPRLGVLNLSHNLLAGPIPSPLQHFPASSFIGNDHLCGSPLNPCPPSAPSNSPAKLVISGAALAIAIGGASLVIAAVLVLLFCCDFGRADKKNNKLLFFDDRSVSFDLEDLLRASAEILGKGSHGTTYKAILDEAMIVVVKRLKDVGGIGNKEFQLQMETVDRHGRHPNLVPLRAYYFSKDEKLLVYEYMPRGSVYAALHGNRSTGTSPSPLDWESRLHISLGAARGLAHIHCEAGGGKFVHGNIKSSNILLTEDLEGCVTDFGLSSMINYYVPATCGVAGGYRAPEDSEVRGVNQKSDVYSFGVLLLEILTGKSPTGHNNKVVDLPRWVHSVVREE